tara:strand:+ start:2206 stop:5028 length:2823 start_codon:yes stop_codon:yes gene_type:complete
MDTKTFLQNTLGSEGHYCVFAFRTEDDRRIQKFYPSIDHIVDVAQNLDSQGYDTYFALATFKEPNSRKVNNVNKLKSFFLDLDCGATKDYPDQDQAIKALGQFCRTLSLPKPMLVNSGRGVHAYWFLHEEVSVLDWVPVAEHLKKLCGVHRLLADPAVTADAARVLRVPTTHNYKTDPPSPVSYFAGDVPDTIDFDVFASLLGMDTIPVPVNIEGGLSAFREALIKNNENKFKNILDKTKVGAGCAQIRTIAIDQEGCSEPLWRAGLSIAKFCSDGTKGAHLISKNHSDYSAEGTADKLENIKGPYLCTSFDEFNPDVCTDCQHWGKIKSPIVLGRTVSEASEEDNTVEVLTDSDDEFSNSTTYTIPPYPKPYFRGANGGVYLRTKNSDGDIDEKIVYHNDLYVVKRIRDQEAGESIVMRLHLPRDGVREFTVPLTAVTSRDEFRKQMSMQGVAVTKMDDIMAYTTAWVNELQATNVADEARRQFGWTGDDYKSFVVGDKEIFADSIGFNPPSIATAGLFHLFEPKGTLEEWKLLSNFYDREGFELHQYIVGTSFGSPLMAFCPISSAGFHVHGKGGEGKTTAMLVGASVWAEPEGFIMDKVDTHSALFNRGEVYKNLPIYIDELTNAKSEDLSQMVYQLSGGKQRARMSGGSNVERFRGLPWSLLSVSTGNTSVIERLTMIKDMPRAEAQRMLETKAVKLFDESNTKSLTDAHQKRAKKVYGIAGKIYMQYILKNLEEVKGLLERVQAKIDKEAGLTAENRFWSAGVACTLTGLIIAKRLGLINYDMKKLKLYVLKLLKENMNSVNDMTSPVHDTLNNYIHEHWGSILKIQSTDDLRKGQGNGLDGLIIPELDPKVRLVGRYETDSKMLYLVPKQLKQWCGKQQINYGSFIQDLKEKMSAKSVTIRLTKGTSTQLPPTRVIVIDCSSVDIDKPQNVNDL